jgi:hypothetical protein
MKMCSCGAPSLFRREPCALCVAAAYVSGIREVCYSGVAYLSCKESRFLCCSTALAALSS